MMMMMMIMMMMMMMIMIMMIIIIIINLMCKKMLFSYTKKKKSTLRGKLPPLPRFGPLLANPMSPPPIDWNIARFHFTPTPPPPIMAFNMQENDVFIHE